MLESLSKIWQISELNPWSKIATENIYTRTRIFVGLGRKFRKSGNLDQSAPELIQGPGVLPNRGDKSIYKRYTKIGL